MMEKVSPSYPTQPSLSKTGKSVVKLWFFTLSSNTSVAFNVSFTDAVLLVNRISKVL